MSWPDGPLHTLPNSLTSERTQSLLRQRKTNTVYHLYVGSKKKKYNKLLNIPKRKQIHRYKEQTSGYWWGREGERGKTGVGEKEVQSIKYKISYNNTYYRLPCSSNGKESACEAGDQGSIPGLGSSSGEGNGNPLQYSGLEN